MKNSCIIINDDLNTLSLIEEYLTNTCTLELKGKFFDVLNALDFLRSNSVDVIFTDTDINVPLFSGIQLSDILPKGQKIIFTTDQEVNSLTGAAYNVIDYLLKPVTFSRFLKAIAKIDNVNEEILSPATNKGNFMFIKNRGKLVRINLEDILYIKGEKEYVGLHFENERLLIYKRMKEMELILPSNFIRVHMSYIINISYLSKVIDNHAFVRLQKIPISNSYKSKFMDLINLKLL
jgi:two-component system, LytTR family, response regulator